MAKPKQKYYVVWQGRTAGIYTDWTSCETQVKGFEGAKYKAFSTMKEAEEAFSKTQEEYIKNASTDANRKSNNIAANQPPCMPALCVDAACSGNPGVMEYRGVYLLETHQNGEKETQELFHRGKFQDATNNIGEFLALVHALALLKQQGNNTLPIYSDSLTAQAWVKQKKAKTKLEPTKNNAVVFELINRAEHWLQTNTWRNPIIKWDTTNWGEIPADFGRK